MAHRPDGWTSTRNFHIWCACIRTMKGSRPDGWSRIGNFLLWWTRVRTTDVRRPDGDIWIVILALRRRASGRDPTSSGRLIDLPFIGTWKQSETVRVLRGVQTCYWNFRTDASWIEPSRHSGVQTVWHVVRTDGIVTDGRSDGMARSSGQLTGNRKSSDSKAFLNSRIPMTHLLHTSDFVQNTEWGQNTNSMDSKTLVHFLLFYFSFIHKTPKFETRLK